MVIPGCLAKNASSESENVSKAMADEVDERRGYFGPLWRNEKKHECRPYKTTNIATFTVILLGIVSAWSAGYGVNAGRRFSSRKFSR
jgi:hypothetical protein